MSARQVAGEIDGEHHADSPHQGHLHQSLMRIEQDRHRDRSASEQHQDKGAQCFANELSFAIHD
jgi:hypothetical protein